MNPDQFADLMSGSEAFTRKDFHDWCRHKGEERALQKYWEKLYTKYYYHKPTKELEYFGDECDELVEGNERVLVELTLNPKPGIHWPEFKDWAVTVMNKRMWVSKVYAINYEETENKGRPPHIHVVFKLKYKRAPSQIWQALFRGAGRKFFGSKEAIDVKKGPMCDASKMINYTDKDKNSLLGFIIPKRKNKKKKPKAKVKVVLESNDESEDSSEELS